MSFVQKLQGKLRNQIVSGILLVTAGNMALLLAKIAAWLLVPRLLGVFEYGYYKTFTLYLTYTSFLHFGFPDGVLLLHGGRDYRSVNKRAFRCNSRFFIGFQGAVAVLFFLTAMLLGSHRNRYIFFMIGIDAFFINITTYFRFIAQAVMRFKELAVRNLIQAFLQLASVAVIFVSSTLAGMKISGKFYIFLLVGIDGLLFLWYLITYREMIFGKARSWKKQAPEIKRYFGAGIVLTAAYQAAHLVFVLDSQMVLVLFSLEIYSLYSFSYSITNMITMTVNAVSMVMFPSLKRIKTKEAIGQFSNFMGIISMLVFLMIACYYPLTWFIAWYLPEYAGALDYLKFLMPGLAITCCINLVLFTYYKVLNALKHYLYTALLSLLAGIALNGCGYLLCKKPEAFSVASMITLLFWYFLAVKYIAKHFQVKWKKHAVYLLMQIAVFYTVSFGLGNGWKAMTAYLICYGGVTWITYRNDLLPIVKGL